MIRSVLAQGISVLVLRRLLRPNGKAMNRDALLETCSNFIYSTDRPLHTIIQLLDLNKEGRTLTEIYFVEDQ